MHCNKKLVCIIEIDQPSLALLLGNFVRVFYGDFVTFSLGLTVNYYGRLVFVHYLEVSVISNVPYWKVSI